MEEQSAITSLLTGIECTGTDTTKVCPDACSRETIRFQVLLWAVVLIVAVMVVFSVLLFIVYKQSARTELLAKVGERFFQNMDK